MRKTRLIFTAIFFVIAIPVVSLLFYSYSQLKTETLDGDTDRSEQLYRILNQRLNEDLSIEEKRSYKEYVYFRLITLPFGYDVSFSELSNFPPKSHYSGLVGHFQLDKTGKLGVPFFPDGKLDTLQYRLDDINQREERRFLIKKILTNIGFNRDAIIDIAGASDSTVDSSQVMTGLDSLFAEEVPADSASEANYDRAIDQFYKQNVTIPNKRNRKKNRKGHENFERSSELENFVFNAESEKLAPNSGLVPIRPYDHSKELEIEKGPFQAMFNSNYMVFYRNVYYGNEFLVQGFVVEAKKYLASIIKQYYPQEQDLQNLALEFSYKNRPLLDVGIKTKNSTKILSKPLLPPFDGINLSVHLCTRPAIPGATLLFVVGGLIFAVLIGGLIAIYRLMQSQLTLAQKRQDFISAVSHELKTPLTAIRMYAELLQNSWVANEEKRKKYYNQIASEAERLTRLIQNVLNLSKLDGNRWNVQLRKERPKAVLDDFIATYTKNVENQGFSLTVSVDTEANDVAILIDRDAIMQILMNLVDNSLKFSKKADYKMIVIELRVNGDDMYLAVRDYGPGIPPAEMNKVFQEFYRVENEMTRQTSGTGIGLSMVKRLCTLTGMKIELENAGPGLRTKIHFPPLSI